MFTLGHHINPEGAITGQYIDGNNVWYGFLRHPDGTFTEFEPPGAGGSLTYAHTITNNGWINGTYWDANSVYHAYVRHPDGTFITFEAPGAGTGNSQGTGAHESRAAAYRSRSEPTGEVNLSVAPAGMFRVLLL